MKDLVFGNQPVVMKGLFKTVSEFYRTCFISTAFKEGIYEKMKEGPVKPEDLFKSLNAEPGHEGFEAWLNLGVSLGELGLNTNGYYIKGSLSRKLCEPSSYMWQAFLQAHITNYFNYITQTPYMVRQKQRFKSDEVHAELIKKSLQVIESLLLDVVDKVIPRRGRFRLLDVGCGSGIYIKRACEHNPRLRAVGLEAIGNIADYAQRNMKIWKLEKRVEIVESDIRDLMDQEKFDLISMYNNIYNFPVAERIYLFKTLNRFLKPGGRVVITAACQGGGPSLMALNLWASMTEGTGALPKEKQIAEQLIHAGFDKVKRKKMIPAESYWLISAMKPKG